jgi:hypothetical protein
MHKRVDHAELKSEIQVEQVQKEYDGPPAWSCMDTNLDLNQGKPWCIKPPSLSFVYLYIFFMILDCALSRRSGIDILVALRLLYPCWSYG